MKVWISLLAVAMLAGCMQNEPSTEGAVIETPPATSLEPQMVEGTLWLSPSSGQTREETLLKLPANASGTDIHATFMLGATYGPTELPVATADVDIELRAPDGSVLARAHIGSQEREGTIEAVTEADGSHTIALLSYGGSDGESQGDHVHYHVEIAPQGA